MDTRPKYNSHVPITAGDIPENGQATLYRLGSNQSRSSIFEDVEMAQEEVNPPYL
jgi:hypothetical protein